MISRAAPEHAQVSVEAETPKFISVAIPTCNRPTDLNRCLGSLARIRYPSWEVIVVDQSDGDESRLATMAWRASVPKLVYARLHQKNSSAARNRAIEVAAGDVLAFIDDDCTVESDWLSRVSEAFAEDGEASIIFGSVVAAEHDPSQTYVPTADLRTRRRLHGTLDALRVRGIGASMYLRLGTAALASFDLSLGPGTRFRSTQDRDYTFRVLASGGTILETPRIKVTHHGARAYAGGAASSKLRDYVYGAGACHAKLLRCGAWRIVLPLIVLNLVTLVARVRPHKALTGRPTNFGRVLMYGRGLRHGFQEPVDRSQARFR